MSGGEADDDGVGEPEGSDERSPGLKGDTKEESKVSFCVGLD